jgi:hypothetical protein
MGLVGAMVQPAGFVAFMQHASCMAARSSSGVHGAKRLLRRSAGTQPQAQMPEAGVIQTRQQGLMQQQPLTTTTVS